MRRGPLGQRKKYNLEGESWGGAIQSPGVLQVPGKLHLPWGAEEHVGDIIVGVLSTKHAPPPGQVGGGLMDNWGSGEPGEESSLAAAMTPAAELGPFWASSFPPVKWGIRLGSLDST